MIEYITLLFINTILFKQNMYNINNGKLNQHIAKYYDIRMRFHLRSAKIPQFNRYLKTQSRTNRVLLEIHFFSFSCFWHLVQTYRHTNATPTHKINVQTEKDAPQNTQYLDKTVAITLTNTLFK